MAKFKPGESGNPGGRPKLPADVKEAKKLTTNKLILTLNKLLFMTDHEILKVIRDPKAFKIEKIVARILQKADQQGDASRLNFLLDRTIGKVTEKVQHTLPRPVIVNKSDGSQMILGAESTEEADDQG